VNVRHAVVGLSVVGILLLGGGQARASSDPSFGNGGGVLISAGSGTTMPWTVAVDGLGRSIVCGFHDQTGFVARYTPAGTPDQSFGSNGFVAFPSQIPSIAVDSNNRVLVGGQLGGAAVVWRLNADGTTDTSYGVGGVTTALPGIGLQRLALDAHNRVVAIGAPNVTTFALTAVRLLPDGGIDPSFGAGGQIATGLTGPGDVIAAGDRVLVGGESGANAAVRAYLSDGSLDLAFGNGGLATVDAGASDNVTAIALGPLGSIVVAGTSIAGNNPFAGLPFAARFTAAGTPDSTFGAGGVVVLSLPGTGGGFPQDAGVDANGRLILTGVHFYVNAQNAFAGGSMLAVLGPDGTADSSYVLGGLALATSGASSGAALQSDGKLIVTGWISGPPTWGALNRYVAVPAPTVRVPRSPLLAEAEGATGAHVTFAASATDILGAPLTPTCLPASGTLFAVGNSIVTCSATDAAGTPAAASFTVRVVDTTAPTLSVANVTAEATSSSGAVASYTASATDTVDGSVRPICLPASGSVFAIGDTQVVCTATDAHQNTASSTFVVHVRGAAEQLATLRLLTTDARLLQKLGRVDSSFAAGKLAQTCTALGQFADEALRDRTPDLAARANRISALLGC
jgi:uncharacterized delta-60 repeat protein